MDDFSKCYVDGEGGGCIYDVIKSECDLDTPDIVCDDIEKVDV